MSIHIGAKKGDIAESILLPGDPLRAKFIAETFLDDVFCYNEVRNMLGFTGWYKGKRVSVQGTGMGIPSISIYANELIREYGCKKLIRVGTAGALQENVKVRDIIVAMAASTTSFINTKYFNGADYAATASFPLFLAAVNKAKELNINVKAGNVLSADEFYNNDPNWHQVWTEHGVLAVEMETYILYTLASKYKVDALGIFTISDSLITGEATTAEERQSTFSQMVELALGLI
ncbi:MAG: purine-nucleoside phosphorylase [Chitinophagales bacterium]|nr:purine-nucleoside phosphorylase [Chitinophagales bacterium]